ncbi:HNH endonuclease signature motif containing protein [Microbacterium sp. USHLN186]|uniref:HNH endonuclease signature motif containing protein n=1 Tax=Microbacterium sp. USHLN186 TaxID=3081286 RepID=UPI0030169B49
MDDEVESLIARRIALLDQWTVKQREIAALQAQSSALLAQRCELWHDEVSASPQHRDAIERSMVAEYAAAGHVSKGSMDAAFADARLLAEEFPAVRDSHRSGDISPAHVREILRESQPVREAVDSGVVDAETLRLYEAAVLEVAENDTAARTRAHARQIAAALAGATVVEQHERALAERAITIRSVGDGLVLLQAVLPEYLGVAIIDRLTKMARHMKRHPEDRVPVAEAPDDAAVVADADDGSTNASTNDSTTDDTDDGADDGTNDGDPGAPACAEEECVTDPRTMDQLRADLFADLLLASDPSAAHGSGLDNITATIQVTVAATTLAGQDDRPAELDGIGPLHPDIARVLAGSRTGWTRLFCDPTGLVVETDTYTPTEPMSRFLRARDQHCRFPGCRQPVHRCQLDHNHDYAKGGRTRIDNLAHFCGSHHPLKHPSIPDQHRWRARQLPDRSVEWVSPNGRTYRDRPMQRVMFVPAADPPTWGPRRFPPPRPDAERPPF